MLAKLVKEFRCQVCNVRMRSGGDLEITFEGGSWQVGCNPKLLIKSVCRKDGLPNHWRWTRVLIGLRIVMTLAAGSTTGSSEPLDACPCRKDMRATCRIQAAKGSSAIFNSLTFHGHYQEIVGSYACLLMWRKLPQVLCLLETILAQSSCIKFLQYLVRCQLCVLYGIENIHEWQKRMQK